MTLKIWGRRNSINVQKVLWCVEELDWTYEREDAGGQYGSPAHYERINPNKRVPTIDLAGEVVWESNTIMRFLAAKAGRIDLYPHELYQRSHVDRWLDWQTGTLEVQMRDVFIPLVREPDRDRDQTRIDDAIAALEHAWAIAERILAERAHLGGEVFTLADIAVGAYWNRWCQLPIERVSRPALTTWAARIASREGFAKHLTGPLV